jgi:hypothetical protein
VLVRCILPTNEVSLKEGSQGCQVPGYSPLIAEAVRLGCRLESWYCPLPWVHLLTVKSDKAISQDFDAALGGDARVDAFRDYRSKLADKVVIIEKQADNSTVKVIRQADSSRYFPEGRRRIRAKIFKRMGKWSSCHGLMLTFTFAPELISKDDAWREVGKRGSNTMDAVNVWRVRHGMPRVRGIRVLEVQKQTGYPHLHYVFPKLKWLCPIELVTEWWSQAINSVDMSYKDSFSPVGYVCKYVSKLEGWSDDALSEIWLNRTRLYSMSRDYYLVAEDKRLPEWSFCRTARLHAARLWFPALVDEYDTVLGAYDLAKEVFLGSGKG